MDEPHDPLALDHQLCFALYAASRAMTGLYRELLADLGLTYPQYLVLLVLWERDALPVKDLGVALRLDSGTLSPLLRRMEAAGWLRRGRCPQDERVVRVSLTGEGVELRERVRAIPGQALRATGVPAAHAAELRGLLEQITRSVEAAAEASRSAATEGAPGRRT